MVVLSHARKQDRKGKLSWLGSLTTPKVGHMKSHMHHPSTVKMNDKE